ncbi:MAG: ribonuclease III [Nitrospirae bacterium]|nr:ribonuclease III [Nitrospirota bacterium]
MKLDALLDSFQKRISYTFKNPDILQESLTHKSYVNENPDENLKDNERLEFLGDSVLSLSISTFLINNYPHLSEGELSRFKSIIVSEPALSNIASSLDIGQYLLLGRGEEHTGGRKKESLLANALEAIIAAIYLDGSYYPADKFIKNNFSEELSTIVREGISVDYKTDLQEYCQGKALPLPVYKVLKESGPDHKKIFEIELIIDGEVYGRGSGKNKKEAEQRAAKEALYFLTNKM